MPVHFKLGHDDRAVYLLHDSTRWIVNVRFWRQGDLLYNNLADLYADLVRQYNHPHDRLDSIELFFDRQGNTLRLLALWEEMLLQVGHRSHGHLKSPFDLGELHRKLMHNVDLVLHAGAQGCVGSDG
jgi:hypothetical protein